jgi:hypothetical protein
MPRSSHSSPFDHPNNTEEVRINNYLIFNFLPFPYDDPTGSKHAGPRREDIVSVVKIL